MAFGFGSLLTSRNRRGCKEAEKRLREGREGRSRGQESRVREDSGFRKEAGGEKTVSAEKSLSRGEWEPAGHERPLPAMRGRAILAGARRKTSRVARQLVTAESGEAKRGPGEGCSADC